MDGGRLQGHVRRFEEKDKKCRKSQRFLAEKCQNSQKYSNEQVFPNWRCLLLFEHLSEAY